MQDFQRDIISLITGAISDDDVSFSNDIDWEQVIVFGQKHRIIPILFYGITNCRLKPPDEIIEKLEKITFEAIAISQNQLWELEQTVKKFDKNGIDYMLLKGATIKSMYPHQEMRQMVDVDILIKKEQYAKTREIMKELGFEEAEESDHELIWDKKGRLHVELHKRLIPSYNKDYYAYFGDGWRMAVPSGKGTQFVMSDEDQFIYVFTHFAKHYRDSGAGIRYIVDLWVYLKAKPNLNRKYIEEQMKVLKLDVFCNNILNMLQVWFEGKTSDKITDFITDKTFGSGIYGMHMNQKISSALKASKSVGSELASKKNFFLLVFLPYLPMSRKYPILKKAPVLLPIMWFVRWFDAIFFKRRSIQNQMRDLQVQTAENIDKYQAELNFVGLDFNFK